MPTERGVDVDSLHTRIEQGVGGADIGILRARNAARFVGTIVFYGRGNEHAVDVHARKGGVVEVGGASIAHTTFAAATEGHEGAHILSAARDDDAGVGDFGVVVSREIVAVGLDIRVGGAGLEIVGRRAVAARRFGIGGRGVEGDVLLASGERQPVFHLHAQGHEMIAEGFAVAKPGRNIAGEGAGLQARPGEGGELGEFALFERGVDAAREGVEHDGEGGEEDYDEEGVESTEFHVERAQNLESGVDKCIVGGTDEQRNREGEQRDRDDDAETQPHHLTGVALCKRQAKNG